MSAFDDAIGRGWQVVYALQIEGIPATFSEIEAPRYDSYSAVNALTSGGTTLTNYAALVVKDNSQISQEIDRRAGVSGGRAVDFLLNYDALGSALQLFFKRPSYITDLTADFDYNDTNISVADNSYWPGSGALYIGKEYVRYGATASNKFWLLSRHEINEKYNFFASSFGSYRKVTDTPTIWRGRRVTLWEHLVTPDGYLLNNTWCSSSSTYSRELWQGFIEESPIPDPLGIRLRCLPIQRMLAKPIGYSTKFDVALFKSSAGVEHRPWDYDYVSLYSGDTIRIWCKYNDPTEAGDNISIATWEADIHSAIPSPRTSPHMMTRMQCDAYLESSLTTASLYASGEDFESLPFVGDVEYVNWTELGITIGWSKVSNYEIKEAYVTVPEQGPQAYMSGMHIISEWMKEGALYGYKMTIPYRKDATGTTALVIHNMEGEGWQDTELQSTGVAVLEADKKQELVHYRKESSVNVESMLTTDHTVITLTERGVGGTDPINLYNVESAKLQTGAGHSGDLKTVMLSLLQSSGTGDRGSFDTLPTGFGYAIDSTNIDEASFGEPGLTFSDLEASCVSDGSASFEELVGGWISVQGRSIVSRMVSHLAGFNNIQKLMVVDWTPTIDPSATTISKTDVILGNALAPKMLEGPNAVGISTAYLSSETPEVMVRDIPRIQSEGPRTASFTCPSMTSELAGLLGASYAYYSDGLTSITLKVGPHVTLQCGDNVQMSLQHPAMFDWATGYNAPAATVYAKVVRTSLNLSDRVKEITLLMASNTDETRYLCPSRSIDAVGGATYFDLDDATKTWFAAGEKILIYNPGKEADGESAEYTIDSLSDPDSDGYNERITVTSSLAAWVAAGSVVTYPVYTNSSDAQKSYAFVKYDRVWSG